MNKEKFLAKLKKDHFILWLALRHHKTHKGHKLSFEDHHYQKDIVANTYPDEVNIKSTQNGISEVATLKSLGFAIKGLDIFHVLPTDKLVGRFVNNRIKKTIKHTSYYKGLEKIAKLNDESQSDSLHLKDIGEGTIAFIGSNSTASFAEFPADFLIIDELDECNQDNLKMAEERLSHSNYRWRLRISNPTFKGMGIDELYNRSDKREWFIKCECGKWMTIDWFKHIVRKIDDGRYLIRDKNWTWDSGRDIYPICHHCGRPLNRKSDGQWVATAPTTRIVGRHITKLFSGTVPLIETLERFKLGQKDPAMLQRFYNADLGEAYTADGSKLTEEMIQNCVGDYQEGPVSEGLVIAGIDVGTFYNYVIAVITPNGIKVLTVGKERDTQQLILKLREYNVKAGVVDAMPETREARKIANCFKMMFVCYYGNSKKDVTDILNKTVTVQRTPALDAVKEAVLTNKISYPKNIYGHREYLDQMTASVRVFNADKKMGGHIGAYEWVEGNQPDHYFHATSYCLVARRLIALMS
jgi:hypothetical protein